MNVETATADIALSPITGPARATHHTRFAIIDETGGPLASTAIDLTAAHMRAIYATATAMHAADDPTTVPALDIWSDDVAHGDAANLTMRAHRDHGATDPMVTIDIYAATGYAHHAAIDIPPAQLPDLIRAVANV